MYVKYYARSGKGLLCTILTFRTISQDIFIERDRKKCRQSPARLCGAVRLEGDLQSQNSALKAKMDACG